MTILIAGGWIGGVLTLLAYGLLIRNYLSASGLWFNIINTIGGLLLVGSALAVGALPNVFLNSVWTAAGLYGAVMSAKRPAPKEVTAPAVCEQCTRSGT